VLDLDKLMLFFYQYRTQSIKSGTRKKKDQNPYSQLEDNDLFPDLRDPFFSAIAIGTGISSCLSISDMFTFLPALQVVTILCNV
jgi:hypothetical protein